VTEAPRTVPTFREFAFGWLERQKLEGGHQGTGLAQKSRQDIEWRLSKALLPAFGETPLDQISREAVDDFRLVTVRESGLRATSINKLLFTLSAVLETAVEYEVITRNTARGRRRRLVAPAAKRPWLDRADHIAALLDAAGQLDRGARSTGASVARYFPLSCLPGCGSASRWLCAGARLTSPAARSLSEPQRPKHGLRTVNLLRVLRDQLVGYRASRDPAPDSLVFGTSKGRENGATKIRRRIPARAVEAANKQLLADGADPLPEHLTPHSLRRTFASLLFAIGESPPYVMAQMGHTTPKLTLAIYARQMNRRDGEPERLQALVDGEGVDHGGTDDPLP
jgi:integrase